jgi:hypothetical protein
MQDLTCIRDVRVLQLTDTALLLVLLLLSHTHRAAGISSVADVLVRQQTQEWKERTREGCWGCIPG